MSLMIDFYDLNNMANSVRLRILQIYDRYLSSKDENFPYDEVDGLLNKYTFLYSRIYNKKKLNIMKLLFDDKKYNAPSKEMILEEVRGRILGRIYFDVHKYIPGTEDDKNIIFNKLLPIIKYMTVSEIADVYVKMKRSASIRNINITNDMLVLFQQMFVDYIMFVENCVIKSNSDIRKLTYEEVCSDIFHEQVLSFSSTNKRVKEYN